MIKNLALSKVLLVILLALIEIGSLYYADTKIERGTTSAMESALKEIYVDGNNQVCIDQVKAYSTFVNHMRSNLNLDSNLIPLSSNQLLGDKVTVDEFIIYDPTTSGLPVNIHGRTYVYPTIHITYVAHVKPRFAQFFNLPVTYPINVHVDESSEPPK